MGHLFISFVGSVPRGAVNLVGGRSHQNKSFVDPRLPRKTRKRRLPWTRSFSPVSVPAHSMTKKSCHRPRNYREPLPPPINTRDNLNHCSSHAVRLTKFTTFRRLTCGAHQSFELGILVYCQEPPGNQSNLTDRSRTCESGWDRVGVCQYWTDLTPAAAWRWDEAATLLGSKLRLEVPRNPPEQFWNTASDTRRKGFRHAPSAWGTHIRL